MRKSFLLFGIVILAIVGAFVFSEFTPSETSLNARVGKQCKRDIECDEGEECKDGKCKTKPPEDDGETGTNSDDLGDFGGFIGGDEGGSSVSSAQSSSPACTPQQCVVSETTVSGMVERCCRETGDYGPFANCTTFASSLHNICDQCGVPCKTVEVECEGGSGPGHNPNLVKINQSWCLVSGQSGEIFYPCSSDPNDIPQSAVCRAMWDTPDCDCEVTGISDDPLPDTGNPHYCSMHSSSLDSCQTCCQSYIDYYESRPSTDPEELLLWSNDCRGACSNEHD